MVVSILGCGWLGMALAKDLVKQGFDVKGSATSHEKMVIINSQGIAGFIVKLEEGQQLVSNSDFWNCDVLIIASNVKLAQNTGYLGAMQLIVALIKTKKINRIIFLSSISVYGEPNDIVDEDTAPAPKTASAGQLLALEELLKNVSQAIVLRLGGLVGPGRMPGTFFAGKKNIPNGLAPVNLIHLTDCIGICKMLLDAPKLPKCLNAVSPDHPSKESFYKAAAAKEGLPLPEFLHEKDQWKIVNSRFMNSLGYQFEIDNWEKLLRAEKAL